MKTVLTKSKSRKSSQPFDVIKVGSISIPIYAHTNIIPHRHPQTGAILYETLPEGKLKALFMGGQFSPPASFLYGCQSRHPSLSGVTYDDLAGTSSQGDHES